MKAILPGRILRILVKEGDQVSVGQAVVVLEAMKLENELYAEQAGVVKEVMVKEGDNVAKDQELVVIA